MGVIVISLGTPKRAGENFGCTWEHLGEPATSLGAPVTNLGVPTKSFRAPTRILTAPATSHRAPTTSPGAHQITVEQSRKNIFFGKAAGAPGNHSCY